MGINSVTVVSSPDLAVGNIPGCVFNLAILSLLDAIMQGQPILTKDACRNVRTCANRILLAREATFQPTLDIVLGNLFT
jgi:hypothetical protein